MTENDVVSEIEKMALHENDLLILRIPEDVNNLLVENTFKTLSQIIPKGVTMLAIFGDMKVEQYDETVMNSLGWYKKNK
jgi:hypothetical protein